MSFSALFLVAVLAGAIGAVSGLGSGVILIPVFTWWGIGIKRAIAVSVLSVLCISIGAAPRYVRHHLTNLKLSAFLEPCAVLGALLGASVTILIGQQSLFLLCGGLLIASWIILWRQRHDPWKAGERTESRIGGLELESSYYDTAERRTIPYGVRRATWAAPLMVAAGAIAGLLGIGGSALTVLIHELILGVPPKVSVATSNLIVSVMALAGASAYLEAGLIDSTLAVPAILGVLLGAWIGSRLLGQMTNQMVRWIFLVVLAMLGIEMIWRGLHGGCH